jgi:hypothetical protein
MLCGMVGAEDVDSVTEGGGSENVVSGMTTSNISAYRAVMGGVVVEGCLYIALAADDSSVAVDQLPSMRHR